MSDHSEIFGREPEPWREPLGALRLTLSGDPECVDVTRAQAEVEELVRVLNAHPPAATEAETLRGSVSTVLALRDFVAELAATAARADALRQAADAVVREVTK